MAFEQTIAAVYRAINLIFTEVDAWFDRPEQLCRYKPVAGGWSIEQILEHITLTNHFLAPSQNGKFRHESG